MEGRIRELSDLLQSKAGLEAECFPVDRYFLKPYLDEILSVDPNEFILCNLERGSNTYTVQLFLCLPELWLKVDLGDILSITKRFTNVFSYYSLIEFTYKYIEINLIELLLEADWIDPKIKYNLVDYLVTSLYPNLVKTDGDLLFFEEGLYGVELKDWEYVKQKFLLEKRIEPALKEVEEVRVYVRSLR